MCADLANPFALKHVIAVSVGLGAAGAEFGGCLGKQWEAELSLHAHLEDPGRKTIRRDAAAHPNQGVGCLWGEYAR